MIFRDRTFPPFKPIRVALWPEATNARAEHVRSARYAQKGDYESAIADDNEALRIEPKHSAALARRGEPYHLNGDSVRAFTDYNRAIQIEPNSAIAHSERGVAYLIAGDRDRAMSDLNEAVRSGRHFAPALISRGVAYLYGGSLPMALVDFERAALLQPPDAYALIWSDIARSRSGQPRKLAEEAKRLNSGAWPAPIIKLFLGQATETQVVAAAKESAGAEQLTLCDITFFVGELLLERGDKVTPQQTFMWRRPTATLLGSKSRTQGAWILVKVQCLRWRLPINDSCLLLAPKRHSAGAQLFGRLQGRSAREPDGIGHE